MVTGSCEAQIESVLLYELLSIYILLRERVCVCVCVCVSGETLPGSPQVVVYFLLLSGRPAHVRRHQCTERLRQPRDDVL